VASREMHPDYQAVMVWHRSHLFSVHQPVPLPRPQHPAQAMAVAECLQEKHLVALDFASEAFDLAVGLELVPTVVVVHAGSEVGETIALVELGLAGSHLALDLASEVDLQVVVVGAELAERPAAQMKIAAG
jgi:hypothetical protein